MNDSKASNWARRGDARSVVITGIGPITASGVGTTALWNGLHSGRSPAQITNRFETDQFRSKLAIEPSDFRPENYLDKKEIRRLDRFGQLSVSASLLALEDAGWGSSGLLDYNGGQAVGPLEALGLENHRVAVQMGSALGGISQAEVQAARFYEGGVRKVDPRVALHVFPGAASCNMAIRFGFTGPNSTNSMSCASGTIAVGEAWRLIRDGIADVALAGGAEAPLAPLSFGAFSIIRAMSTRNEDPSRACRPFDESRDGFVMGEGSCVMVLEAEEHAVARNARIYARLCGYGNSNDAHHMTAPRPDGREAQRAMVQALTSGGLSAEEVGYVNAHASSTPLNDSTESRAIRSLLGTHADHTPVSGTKPFYGHALGASGAIEIGITAMALYHGWLPPTLNLENPGEDCDLDYVTGDGRKKSVDVALSNSFGFGGINAAVTLSRV